MNILYSTHHFLRHTGTETFALTLIRELLLHQHQVTLYTHYLNQEVIASLIDYKNFHYTTNISELKNSKFDVAHVCHNINAIEVRATFPSLPIIFQSHGVIPFLEQPPMFNLNISQYLAVSEEIRDNLINNHIPSSKILIYRNLINSKGNPTPSTTKFPFKKALVLTSGTNHLVKDKILTKVCKQLKINLSFVGGSHTEVNYQDIHTQIKNSDLVFSVGRGIMESLILGVPSFVINEKYYCGFVTPSNFKTLIRYNFSGRAKKLSLSADSILHEIKNFCPIDTIKLSEMASKNFSLTQNYDKYENLYVEISKSKIKILEENQQTIKHIHEIITTTRTYSKLKTTDNNLLEEIRSSKLFRLWPYYVRLKKLLNLRAR